MWSTTTISWQLWRMGLGCGKVSFLSAHNIYYYVNADPPHRQPILHRYRILRLVRLCRERLQRHISQLHHPRRRRRRPPKSPQRLRQMVDRSNAPRLLLRIRLSRIPRSLKHRLLRHLQRQLTPLHRHLSQQPHRSTMGLDDLQRTLRLLARRRPHLSPLHRLPPRHRLLLDSAMRIILPSWPQRLHIRSRSRPHGSSSQRVHGRMEYYFHAEINLCEWRI